MLKPLARVTALLLVLPALVSFAVRRRLLGDDRALEGTSQLLAQIPGLPGQYVRRAFFAHTLDRCAATAVIGYGTLLSKRGARIDDNVYVGPYGVLGLVHIERDVLIGSGVQITSGRHTHGTADPAVPIRDQEGRPTLVRIGAGAWIGSGAIVMADVGCNAIVGAGAVVTQPVPDAVIAAGVPARVVRPRDA
jgi:acetyltransferase-like isoleucine patch superfamily enzyme